MNTTELLAVFREEVVDLQAPYLWSDNLIYGYIDEAQKQFCRDTYGIADARSFKINILADGTEWYKLDPRILKIRDATHSDTGRKVQMCPVEKMAAYDLRFDGRRGPVLALITGLEKNVVRTVPVPNVAATVNLLTFRLPDDVVAGDDFEIDPQHERALLHWVKHKAYAVQDTEVYDKDASDKHLNAHIAYCARAKEEQSRATHEAGAVVYGGL